MIFLLTQLSEMHGMGRVKMYAIIKTVYFFDWMPWTSTRSSQWQVFLEINLNKILLKLYTSWVHRKNQCRSTVKNMLCYEANVNINILRKYLLKTNLNLEPFLWHWPLSWTLFTASLSPLMLPKLFLFFLTLLVVSSSLKHA